MIMFSYKDQSTTEFGFSNSCFNKIITKGDEVIVHATPNINRFLSWLLEPEINLDQSIQDRKLLNISIRAFWNHRDGIVKGNFNQSHYDKILESISNREYNFTSTTNQSRIPKVKLKTIYPH